MASSTPARALGRSTRRPAGCRSTGHRSAVCRVPTWTWGWLLGAILLLCCGCGPQGRGSNAPDRPSADEAASESSRPSARPELMETLRRDLAERFARDQGIGPRSMGHAFGETQHESPVEKDP